ncbi:ABC transporter substrate-binding protein [Aliamphritea spongicola]|uniref:ABC transporter substrate-binding protein n=1 Tax=Aliamphritea spongicola TaxID=707589 RepID=UPI00196A83EE|nr:ABC transporter substrate-binding protein [Aliamphritea spongicola]MBN3562716.1 ABC transporter substrate-binding protein [Aliamphritea spongicola]
MFSFFRLSGAALLWLAAFFSLPAMAGNYPLQVTDLAGRSITIEREPQRIILGDSRYIYALGILNKDNPVRHVVGMLSDLKDLDYGSYQQYRQRFPEIDSVAGVGMASADSFSVEAVLTLQADLAIFSVDGHGPGARHKQIIDQLQRAGVKVVFIDFRNDPLVNTPKSMRVLGQVLGREAQADAFLDFYDRELQRVAMGLKEAGEDAPEVFLHSRVGLNDSCCETMAKGMMATFIDEAGGDNMARLLVPGSAGVMNPEYLLTHQPDLYVATAIGSPRELQATDSHQAPPFISLGAGVSEQQARASFRRALGLTGERTGAAALTGLTTIQRGEAYAIWHHFYNSPLNVAAVQVFAKWMYPQAFADLNPDQTLQTLFERFQPVPLEGTYWVKLTAEQAHQVSSRGD